MEVRRREGEMIIWAVPVWSQGGVEVPSESPMRQADMAISNVTLTPSISALHISYFPFSRCVVRCLSFVIFSAPSCFSSGIVLYPVLFCTSVICFFFVLHWAFSHTALYGPVVLSSIKQGEHVIVLTTHPLCMTAPQALSAEDPLGAGTQSSRHRWMHIHQAKSESRAKRNMWILTIDDQTPVCFSPFTHRPEEVHVQYTTDVQ